MPTFNQLVRKGRQTVEAKSTAPALQKGYNSLKKKPTDTAATCFYFANLPLKTNPAKIFP